MTKKQSGCFFWNTVYNLLINLTTQEGNDIG